MDGFRGVIGRRFKSLVGPRPGVLICAALLVFGLLGAFALLFVDSQAKSRHEAEKAFAAEARITSQLTSSLFTSSAAATQAEAAKVFGGPKPSRYALTALAKRSRLAYALILRRDGRVLAASAGTPAAVQARAATHVRV